MSDPMSPAEFMEFIKTHTLEEAMEAMREGGHAGVLVHCPGCGWTGAEVRGDWSDLPERVVRKLAECHVCGEQTEVVVSDA